MKSFCKSFILYTVLFVSIVISTPGCYSAGKAAVGESKKQAAPAVINNVVITESDIRREAADAIEAIELKKLTDAASYVRSERTVMIEALERILAEKLLDLEAAEQGITKEQLISREISEKIEEPSDGEIDRIYELNRTRVNRPKKDVEDQLREFLRDRSEMEIRKVFISRLEQKYKVVRNLEPHRFDVKTDGYPSIGPKNAPVKLVLFSDFECPYCRDFGMTLMEIADKYDDKVHIVFRQFPLVDIHENAQRAAEASLCADDQKHFREMHDTLFDNQHDLSEGTILALARRLNLDMEKFGECLSSGRNKSKVREDIRAGSIVGVEATPTLFVNGIPLSGNQPYEAVAAVINKELGDARE